MGEDVLGVQRDAAQVSVLLDEVEQLGGVGHPERQRSCDVLLLLLTDQSQAAQRKNRTKTKKKKKKRHMERKLLDRGARVTGGE